MDLLNRVRDLRGSLHTISTADSLIETAYDGDLTKVTIFDWVTNQRAAGYALRNGEDRYNSTIGRHIALNRALARLARKNEKYWVRETR